MTEKEADYRCPLCGRSFLFHRGACSRACPLGRHCNLVCCPHCGYSFPQGSKILESLKRGKRIFLKAFQKKGNQNPSPAAGEDADRLVGRDQKEE